MRCSAFLIYYVKNALQRFHEVLMSGSGSPFYFVLLVTRRTTIKGYWDFKVVINKKASRASKLSVHL